MFFKSATVNVIFLILIAIACLLLLYIIAQFIYGSLLRMYTTLGTDLMLNMRSRSSTADGGLLGTRESSSARPDNSASPRTLTQSTLSTLSSCESRSSGRTPILDKNALAAG